MQVGVSTSCLFPMETEKALHRIGEMGIDRAEVFLNSPSEAKPEFARLLRSIADDHGIKVTAIHPYCSEIEGMTFFGRYPRRFDDGIEEYRRMFEVCGITGAEHLVFHGAKPMLHIDDELYFERYERLMRAGEAMGVTICQENVARCVSRDAGFLKRMREALPDVSFTFDVKQSIRAGVSVEETIEAMGPNIRRVHISDHRPDCDCVPPGLGYMNYPKLFKSLKNVGFDGELMIELYRWNFASEEELERSSRFLKELVLQNV